MASVVNMRHHPALRAALDGAEAHGNTMRIDRKTRWGKLCIPLSDTVPTRRRPISCSRRS